MLALALILTWNGVRASRMTEAHEPPAPWDDSIATLEKFHFLGMAYVNYDWMTHLTLENPQDDEPQVTVYFVGNHRLSLHGERARRPRQIIQDLKDQEADVRRTAGLDFDPLVSFQGLTLIGHQLINLRLVTHVTEDENGLLLHFAGTHHLRLTGADADRLRFWLGKVMVLEGEAEPRDEDREPPAPGRPVPP